jgi:hypothetical protein
MIIRYQYFGGTVLMSMTALSMAAGVANARVSTQTAKTKTTQNKKPTTTETKPLVEPKAIELLRTSHARLAPSHSMSFAAVVTCESPSRLGIPLTYTTKSDVILQRPDKLREITSGDGPASEFHYDGKITMAYAPAEDLVAVADNPPTIDATMGGSEGLGSSDLLLTGKGRIDEQDFQ